MHGIVMLEVILQIISMSDFPFDFHKVLYIGKGGPFLTRVKFPLIYKCALAYILYTDIRVFTIKMTYNR